MRDHQLQVAAYTIGIRAANLAAGPGSQNDARQRRLERHTEAPKPPTKTAIQIEKSEMESRGHADAYSFGAACTPPRPHALSRVASPRPSAYHAWINEHPPDPVKYHWLRAAGGIGMAERERVYSEEEVVARLKSELPHWFLEKGWIRRKYKTHSWKGTLMVVNTVGHLAESAWHHPDITASYAWVEVRLQNHAAKGITDKDFTLAKKIEEVIQWQPAKEGGVLEGTPNNDPRFAYLKYDS